MTIIENVEKISRIKFMSRAFQEDAAKMEQDL